MEAIETMEADAIGIDSELEAEAEFRETIGNVRGLGKAFIVGALAITGVIFADTRQTEDDARGLAASMREHESDVWRQIVVYRSDDMSIVEQLDLTHREITTDAPLLEPLSS